MKRIILFSTIALSLSAGASQQSMTSVKESQMTGPMSFFITSVGGGDGANYGGLKGADAHCQKLAAEVGAGEKKWRAYLSTSGHIDFKNPENNVAAIDFKRQPAFRRVGEINHDMAFFTCPIGNNKCLAAPKFAVDLLELGSPGGSHNKHMRFPRLR